MKPGCEKDQTSKDGRATLKSQMAYRTVNLLHKLTHLPLAGLSQINIKWYKKFQLLCQRCGMKNAHINVRRFVIWIAFSNMIFCELLRHCFIPNVHRLEVQNLNLSSESIR